MARLGVDMAAALAAAGSSHQLQLWSAEQPQLYLLLIKLAAGGQLLEVEGCQVSSRGTAPSTSDRPAQRDIQRSATPSSRVPSCCMFGFAVVPGILHAKK